MEVTLVFFLSLVGIAICYPQSGFIFPDQLQELLDKEIKQTLVEENFTFEEPEVEQEIIIQTAPVKNKAEEKLTPTQRYNAALDFCTDHDQMPFYDQNYGEFLCYPLLEQGPCKDGEWYILNENLLQPVATCAKRPCNGSTELIPYIDGTCEVLYYGAKCPPGMELLPTPFGKGNFFRKFVYFLGFGILKGF
jgi:hypothetical protein